MILTRYFSLENVDLNSLKEIKVLAFLGDLFGCRQYRVRIPSLALQKYNVTVHETAFLPSQPGVNQFQLLVDEFSKYDMIFIQRCYLREVVETLRSVCSFLNIPMVFEVDDDYLSIPIS